MLTFREAQKCPGEWVVSIITLRQSSAFLHTDKGHTPQLQKLACFSSRALMGKETPAPPRAGISNLIRSTSHLKIISAVQNCSCPEHPLEEALLPDIKSCKKELRMARLTNNSLKIFRLLEHWHDFAKLAKSSYL